MRLTLRMILEYMDDALEPAVAKAVGAKVQENAVAQDLVERIKTLVRKRRLMAPTPMDANTLAEYLDESADDEAMAEVEKIFLASDAHLAEVAQCHSIQKLLAVHTPVVSESMKKRMNDLVKGGPAKHPLLKGDLGLFAAVPATKPKKPEPAVKPPRRESFAARYRGFLIALAGVVVVGLLGVAVWQFLDVGTEGVNKNVPPMAQEKPAEVPTPLPPPPLPVEEKKLPAVVEEKKQTLPPVDVNLPPPPISELPPVPLTELGVDVGKSLNLKVAKVPYAAPVNKSTPLGKILAPPGAEAPLLLQRPPEGSVSWTRLGIRSLDVLSGKSVVNLPGLQTTIQFNESMQAKLVGNFETINPALRNFERFGKVLTLSPFVYFDFETAVDWHQADGFDLDFTLRKGRVILTSLRSDRPVTVRVRVENPTIPDEPEYWDFTLHDKGTEVYVDCLTFLVPGEPFYRKPNHPEDKGPAAFWQIFLAKGTASVMIHDQTKTLSGRYGSMELTWNSREGMLPSPKLHPENKRPDWSKDALPVLPGQAAAIQAKAILARDFMLRNLRENEPDVAIGHLMQSNDPGILWFSIRSLGAQDDIRKILDFASQTNPVIRFAVVNTLYGWAGQSRAHDHILYEQLKINYEPSHAAIIMDLLHGFSEERKRQPETKELLVGYLQHPNPLVQSLAGMMLPPAPPKK